MTPMPVRATPSPTFAPHAQQTEHGIEHWLARNLQHLLGYAEWRNFSSPRFIVPPPYEPGFPKSVSFPVLKCVSQRHMLNLLGVVQRSTVDIDVIAIGRDVTSTSPGRIVEPQGLPPELAADIARLTRDFDLPSGWINTTVAVQWRAGLPPGFEERIGWRHLGGLWLGLAGRQDLIALKLHATADNDRQSRHLADLIALRPTAAELATAAAWVEGQDAGPAFRSILQEVVAHVATHTR